MKRTGCLLASLALWGSTSAAGPVAPHPAEISVSRSEVHMGDIIADLEPGSAALDLGPAPAANGSRVIDRDEIVRLFHEHGVDPPHVLPSAVRIIRKMQRLEARDIADLVRGDLVESPPRGVTVVDVHGARTSVPGGWTRTTCEIPRPPHRTGPLTSQASLTFYENEQALWRISVPVDLSLSHEAMAYDLARGSRVTLVVRRGLVEVSSTGTAGADADVGDLVPVILLPSGRTLSARLEDKDHAVSLGAP
jgi:hypothetical protein